MGDRRGPNDHRSDPPPSPAPLDRMARPPRCFAPGQTLHLVQRGNNRSTCFADDADRVVYLGMLAELAGTTRCAVHAYVLMGNHVHLLVTPETPNAPSSLMQRIGMRFAAYVNRRHRRTGTLWEGRFRSSIVDTDDYVVSCHRYIELNPVRASMVLVPGDYPWSSYRANALGSTDPVVTPHALYRVLADTDEGRRLAYRRLFEDALSAELLGRLRDCTNGGFVLGSPKFERQVAAMVGRRTWKGSPGRPRKESDFGDQGQLALELMWSVPVLRVLRAGFSRM